MYTELVKKARAVQSEIAWLLREDAPIEGNVKLCEDLIAGLRTEFTALTERCSGTTDERRDASEIMCCIIDVTKRYFEVLGVTVPQPGSDIYYCLDNVHVNNIKE